jgi:hypothetical protein
VTLPNAGHGRSASWRSSRRIQIADSIGVPESGAFKRLLADMVQRGLLTVEGKGTPQDPHRYSLPDDGPPENDVTMRGPDGSGTGKSASEAKTPPSGPFGPRLLLWDQGAERPSPSKMT